MHLHFISHTHWDREWYETFEAFRFRLVELMDHLLSILSCERDYHSFTLDGQTVILEDYLEIRPEKRDELRKLVWEGKLFIGPWYILPDEFLVSAETHVRNLLWGSRICREFGGRMAVGYLPDSFGHIAQMPQILAKSGIRYATFWRGVPDTVKESEFFWEAPDGSRVLVLYMPFGYGIAANLPNDAEHLRSRIERLLQNLTPFARTKHLLFTNGSDHVEPDAELPEKLETLRRLFPEHQILHSNFPYLFRCLEEEVQDLPTYRGEWRADDRNYLLGGTLSTRVYLKKEHHFFSHTLEGHLEPLFSALFALGRPYPEDFLRFLWKMLLYNSPHDSICGCSIDPVHEEMMLRYAKMRDLTRKLLQPSFVFQGLVEHSGEETLVLFNPHPYPLSTYLECDLVLQRRMLKEVDFEVSKLREYSPSPEPFFGSIILHSDKESIEAEILDREETVVFETPPQTLPEVFQANRYRVGVVVRDLPPLGFRIFRLEGKKEQEVLLPPQEWVLENEFLEVRVTPEGTLLWKEKDTGRVFPVQIFFEDGADAGDEYDYSPCLEDQKLSTAGLIPEISWSQYTRARQKIRLDYLFELPMGLTEDRKRRQEKWVPCPLRMEVGLSAGMRRLDLWVTFENRAEDHRLRMHIVSPFTTETSFTGAHFAVAERRGEETTFPCNDFVFLQEEGMSLGVFLGGLREYALQKEKGKTALAITLLRAVGWLSRSDLLTRKGDAGWPFPTPGAQCLGKHEFSLALLFQPGEFPHATLPQEALFFARPPLPFQVRGTVRLSEWWLFRLDNPRILLSALKKSEQAQEIVLRLYNPTPRKESCVLQFGLAPLRVRRLSLLEEEEEVLAPGGNALSLTFGPQEIKTLGILFP